MKKDETANKIDLIDRKMTLRDYFASLPEATQIAPRRDLIEKIAARCEVPASTARSWLAYGVKPRYQPFLIILSEETGIPIENLYID